MNIDLILFALADALDDLWTELAYDEYQTCMAAHDEFNPEEWDSTAKAIWLSNISIFTAKMMFWLDKEEPPRPFFEVGNIIMR